MPPTIVSGAPVTYVQFFRPGPLGVQDAQWTFPEPQLKVRRSPEDLDQRTFAVWEGVLRTEDGRELPFKSDPYEV